MSQGNLPSGEGGKKTPPPRPLTKPAKPLTKPPRPLVKPVKPAVPKVSQPQRPSGNRNVQGRLPCQVNHIVAVEFLDGKEAAIGPDGNVTDVDAVASEGAKQFVNLPKDVVYIDGGDIQNVDRLSRTVRVRVRFQKPGTEQFSYFIRWDSSNHDYSQAEEGRNNAYIRPRRNQVHQGTTDPDGKKVFEITLAACGGDQFWVTAWDTHGTSPVNSTKLRTWRRVYVQPLKMRDVDDNAYDTVLEKVPERFQPHYIELKVLGEQEMNHINVEDDDSDMAFVTEASAKYDQAGCGRYGRYVLAFAWADLNGRMAMKTFTLNNVVLKSSDASHTVEVPLNGCIPEPALNHPDDWQTRQWFTAVVFEYTDLNKVRQTVNVPRARCTPVAGSDRRSARSVRVDLSAYTPAWRFLLPPRQVTGTLRVTLTVLKRNAVGWSFSGSNLIAAFTAGATGPRIGKIMIHEIGHSFGMVPDPNSVRHQRPGMSLDKGACYYEEKGHNGPHCYYDLPQAESYEDPGVLAGLERLISGRECAANCVMFGSVVTQTRSFCPDCGKSIRKVDLGGGWSTSTELMNVLRAEAMQRLQQQRQPQPQAQPQAQPQPRQHPS